MKKILAGIAVGVCAAVMCVGLAACGPDAKEAAKNAESIEVTEQEWNDALGYFKKDGAEFAAEGRMEEFPGAYDDYIGYLLQTGTGSFRYKDGKSYIKSSGTIVGEVLEEGAYVDSFPEEFIDMASSALNTEYYFSVEDGVYFLYTKDDEDKWKKEDSLGVSPIRSYEFYFNYLSFENFKYSEEEKGYVGKPAIDESLSSTPFSKLISKYTFVLKFGKVGDDVRLVAMRMLFEDQTAEGETGEVGECSYIFSYTGVADIDLPSVD